MLLRTGSVSLSEEINRCPLKSDTATPEERGCATVWEGRQRVPKRLGQLFCKYGNKPRSECPTGDPVLHNWHGSFHGIPSTRAWYPENTHGFAVTQSNPIRSNNDQGQTNKKSSWRYSLGKTILAEQDIGSSDSSGQAYFTIILIKIFAL